MSAGAPAWNTPAGGNHNWVEVWFNGAWSFTGAAEWTPAGWNSTWFYPEPVREQVKHIKSRLLLCGHKKSIALANVAKTLYHGVADAMQLSSLLPSLSFVSCVRPVL